MMDVQVLVFYTTTRYSGSPIQGTCELFIPDNFHAYLVTNLHALGKK